MEIVYHISWARTSSDYGGNCNGTIVRNGNLIGKEYLTCQYGCSGTISSLQYICTEFSINDNWSFGSRVISYDFSAASDNIITVGFTGNAWLGFGRWNVSTTFNMKARNFFGPINSSPHAITLPILRLQSGCYHTIPMAVSDPDGDVVRCRWAVGKECESVCNAIPGAVLDTATCTITYSANNGTGYKAVAVMVEDFIPGSSQPLSSVAFQFLVLVVSSSQPCYHKPKFIAPTPSSGSCVSIPLGGPYTAQLRAYSGHSDASITEIQIASANDVRKGSLSHITNTHNYYVSIQWIPKSTHQLCFVAINSDGIASDQSCIQVNNTIDLLQPSPPHHVPWTNKLLVHLTDVKLPIDFDKSIQLSQDSAFIIFVEQSSDVEVYRIKASSSSPSELNINNLKPKQMIIMPNYTFTDRWRHLLH